MIPLPPEVPFEVCISSRVTTRFSGECDFDATVRKRVAANTFSPPF